MAARCACAIIGACPTVGVLWDAASAEESEPYFTALRKGLEDLGYVDGRTVHMQHRFATDVDQLKRMAAELVSSNVDVLVGITGGAYYLKAATDRVPLVFTLIFDAVDTKLVESLSKPGGNATGMSVSTFSLLKKRFQLLANAVPDISRIGLMVGVNEFGTPFAKQAARAIAGEMGLNLELFEARTVSDFEPLFDNMTQAHIQALVLASGTFFFLSRELILRLAIERRLPTCVWSKEMLSAGALIYYGIDLSDMVRRAAPYVDRILRGANPAELPVEEPTSYKFGINLKTAQSIGLEVPPMLLARADEVIE